MEGGRNIKTYIGSFHLVGVVEYVPQYIHFSIWLDGNAGLHARLMNVADQFARGGFGGGIARVGGVFGCR